MTVRELNRMKKWSACLRCGRRIYTDRCHRICPKCHQRNAKEGRIREVFSSASRALVTEKLGSADELVHWFSNS